MTKNQRILMGAVILFFIVLCSSVSFGYGWRSGFDDGLLVRITPTTEVEVKLDVKSLEDAGYIDREPISGWVWSNQGQSFVTDDIDWEARMWNWGYREGYIDGWSSNISPLDWFKIYNFKEEK